MDNTSAKAAPYVLLSLFSTLIFIEIIASASKYILAFFGGNGWLSTGGDNGDGNRAEMFVKPEYMFDGKVILPSKITKHTVEKHAAEYQSLDCIIKRWLNNIYEKFVS